jgi:hypothetical protein
VKVGRGNKQRIIDLDSKTKQDKDGQNWDSEVAVSRQVKPQVWWIRKERVELIGIVVMVIWPNLAGVNIQYGHDSCRLVG